MMRQQCSAVDDFEQYRKKNSQGNLFGRDGLAYNHKRVCQIYRELEVNLRMRLDPLTNTAQEEPFMLKINTIHSTKYLVSIIIPTYNRADLLGKAISSALKQSWNNIEIVVSDNCSDDNTKEIVSTFNDKRIKYSVNEENIGPILNWRAALKKANGQLSIILSDDDYFIDERYIENSVNLFNKYDSVNLVITDCVLGRGKNTEETRLNLSERVDGRTFFYNFWTGNFNIPVISNVFRTSKALELDPFSDNQILYSDIELWLKLMLVGDVGYIRSPSVYYNFHGENIVTNLSRQQLVINARFIRNICDFMEENKYSSTFIKDWAYKFIRKYILFISSINDLKNKDQLHKDILHEAGLVK